jgi:hypothetical protein
MPRVKTHVVTVQAVIDRSRSAMGIGRSIDPDAMLRDPRAPMRSSTIMSGTCIVLAFSGIGAYACGHASSGAESADASDASNDTALPAFGEAGPPSAFDATVLCPDAMPEGGAECAENRFARCTYQSDIDGALGCSVDCECRVIPEGEWWDCRPEMGCDP